MIVRKHDGPRVRSGRGRWDQQQSTLADSIGAPGTGRALSSDGTCREGRRSLMRMMRALEQLLQDVRIARRRIRQTPGFTAAAIVTLALGLGLTSVIMSLAYALFLRPLPVDDAARVVVVEQTRADRPGG